LLEPGSNARPRGMIATRLSGEQNSAYRLARPSLTDYESSAHRADEKLERVGLQHLGADVIHKGACHASLLI